MRECGIGEEIEPSTPGVARDLFIPRLCIKVEEPGTLRDSAKVYAASASPASGYRRCCAALGTGRPLPYACRRASTSPGDRVSTGAPLKSLVFRVTRKLAPTLRHAATWTASS